MKINFGWKTFKKIMEKKLLVLDLDETLIFSVKERLNYPESFIYNGYHIYLRPNLSWFLNNIKSYYKIGIWSVADDEYVEHIVKKIIPKNIDLEFIWSKSWMSPDSFDGKQYIKKMNELKHLGYNLDELVLVDDNKKNTSINLPNSILIKQFKGDVGDKELQKIYNQLILT